MKIFDLTAYILKHKKKTILEQTLEEVERICKEEQKLKGVEAVDEYYKKHLFDMNKVMPKKKNEKRKSNLLHS